MIKLVKSAWKAQDSDMTKAERSDRLAPSTLKNGQVWQMVEANLEMEAVGRLLVNYKLGKPNAIRVSKSCSSIKSVLEYLKTHKAVLA